jgi:hypothetical protein
MAVSPKTDSPVSSKFNCLIFVTRKDANLAMSIRCRRGGEEDEHENLKNPSTAITLGHKD